MPLIISCSEESIPLSNDTLSNDNSISHFSLLKEHNPSLSEDIVMEIEGNQIFGKVPLPYGAKIDSLICNFAMDGAYVKVNDDLQTSGISSNSFRDVLYYDVHSQSEIINQYEVFIKYFTGLPVISINTDNNEEITSKENYVKGSIDIYGTNNYEDLVSNIKIRGRGNSTWVKFPKKPYQIKFDDKESMLGMAPDKKWILLANYSDKTLLRNEIAFELGRLSNLDWTPESQFVELFINNLYQGTYQITQKVEESSNRVNIGDNGFLLEVDHLNRLDDDDVYFTTDRYPSTESYLFNIKEPKVDYNDEKFIFIKNYITDVENILFSDDFKDPIDGYRKYIDVESFVDWYIINELTKNNDAAFVTSVYMDIVPNDKLKMGPIWDFDIAMGNINYNGNENPFGFWIKNNASWVNRLFQDDYFVNVVKERFKYFTQNKNLILGKIVENANRLDDAQTENFQKWDILGMYVWPNNVYFGTYKEEVNYLHTWLLLRWDWMSNAISNL